MTHLQIHELERRIATVLEKGFSRPPSPHERTYDKADFIQMAHDVADEILSDYHIDLKDSGYERDKRLSKALESTLFGMDVLTKQLNEFVMGRKSDGSPS